MRVVLLIAFFVIASCSDNPEKKKNLHYNVAQNQQTDLEEEGYNIANSNILQAEDADLKKAEVATNKSGYLGRGFADYKGSDSSVTWNVDFPPGYYQIEVRYGSGDDRPSTLIINDDIRIDLELKVQGSKQWTNWVIETSEEFLAEVPITKITIDADGKSPGPNLDQIEVVKTASLPISEPAEGMIVLQAEDANGFNATPKKNHSGYLGDGFMDFGDTGSYIEWSSLNLNPGQYRLVFRYGAGKSRPSSVIVNGSGSNQGVSGDNRYDLELAESSPASWSTWLTEDVMINTMGEGFRSLIVYADRSTGPNLDLVEIHPIQIENEEEDDEDQVEEDDNTDVDDEDVPPVTADSKIKLPIEVIGEQGKIVSQALLLSAEQANRARKIYLRINNLSYQNKASIRVNNSQWVDLNHNTVTMEEAAEKRGGMVHGGYNTLRLSMPINSFVAGQNVIRFRFNESDGISIGYRIIELNITDSNNNHLLSPDLFESDDPSTWEQPLSGDTIIEEGKNLWYQAPLVSNYLSSPGNWYNSPIATSAPIRATCSDCHTQDGRDLEIFAYSNSSIIERSKFHGLTEEEGKKIASYIRSLSSDPKISRAGRPWNPPFQPGPEMANVPAHEWPAGAGLDAVLEKDEDMLTHMFSKPVQQLTQSDVEAYFDSDKMWDTSSQPLAIQLPDWKRWLPLIHPKDSFGAYYDNPDKWNPKYAYEETRNYLNSIKGNINVGIIDRLYSRFWKHFRLFLEQGGSTTGTHWRTDDGNAFTMGLKAGVSKEMAATSLARLMAVKYFEFHHEFDLHSIVQDENRNKQWIGRNKNVFEVPSHITGCYDLDITCHNYRGQPKSTGLYESTSWYQLQQVLNPITRNTSTIHPVDYNYQPPLILRAIDASGIEEPVRFYFSSNVMYQTKTKHTFGPDHKNGFFMRVMGPWLFYGADNRNNPNGLEYGEIPRMLNDRYGSKKFGTMIVEAQIKQFLKEMGKAHNSLATWPRRDKSGSGNDRFLERANLQNSDGFGSNHRGKNRYYAQKIYWVIPRFIDLGVNCSVINDLKAWFSEAWPNVSISASEFRCNN